MCHYLNLIYIVVIFCDSELQRDLKIDARDIDTTLIVRVLQFRNYICFYSRRNKWYLTKYFVKFSKSCEVLSSVGGVQQHLLWSTLGLTDGLSISHCMYSVPLLDKHNIYGRCRIASCLNNCEFVIRFLYIF